MGNWRSGPPMTVLKKTKSGKSNPSACGCFGLYWFAPLCWRPWKVRFYDLKLDEILQKDPGFGGVIPRFLGKYLSTDDFSRVIIFQ